MVVGVEASADSLPSDAQGLPGSLSPGHESTSSVRVSSIWAAADSSVQVGAIVPPAMSGAFEVSCVIDEWKNWVDGLIRSPAQPPAWLTFQSAPTPEARLVPDVDYFTVRVHRIHLAYERQWFETYSPLLTIATQFSYGGETVTLPYVIGPATFEKVLGRAAPATFTVAGSTVCGPHPLREPRVTVTVALHRVARSDLATGFLDAVEGAAKALDLVVGLTPYTAMARVIANGVTALTGGDRPLIARRDEFQPALTSYYALVAPTPGVDTRTLVVSQGELKQRIGTELQPFLAADYVLYSVDRATPEDVDVTRLPLHKQWLAVLEDANAADTQEIWDSAKANLTSLSRMAFTSPDLTWAHADQLEQEWIAKAQERRARALRRGQMGGSGDDEGADAEAPSTDPAAVAARARSMSVLDL